MNASTSSAEALMRRFAFNQATAKYWPMPELVAGCVQAGVTNLGLWREQVADYGLAETKILLADNGLTVPSLCRGGFFTSDGWYDSNRRAIDEAAELGTSVLVLVSGGLPEGSKDLPGAREQVADAIGQLVPHAQERGVTLAIEPLHPMFASDRCVIVTLNQALNIAERFDPAVVGVTVDTYHIWWDDQALEQIARAGERVAIFQIADWGTPLPAGVLNGRIMPGDGCIEQRQYLNAVTAAGYTGPIEVEIFNEDVWARPGAEILLRAMDGYRATLC